MAARPILDIDVKDEKFRDFYALFQQYKEQVEKLPDDWAKVGSETDSLASAVGSVTAALLAQNEMLAQQTKARENEELIVRRTEHSMGKIVGHSWQLAKNIKATALDFLKISTVVGAVSGLLGVGSLFGIDRLARTASGGLRAARGLGTTIGERSAFNLNYGRFFDPESVLGSVADARSDWSRRWIFSAMGISGVDKKSTSDLALEAADRARSLFKNSDRSQQFAQARGLTELFSMDDLRRMAEASDEEWSKQRQRFQRDRNDLNVSPKTGEAWQTFMDQLNRAGQKIETVFINDLGALIPGINRLSAVLSDIVDAFMRNPDVTKWIDEFGKSLEEFAKHVGSHDFKADVETFVSDIQALARAVGKALHWIASWVSDEESPKDGGKQQSAPDDDNRDPEDYGWAWDPKQKRFRYYPPKAKKASFTVGDPGGFDQTYPTADEAAPRLRQIEARNGLPAGALSAVYEIETASGRRVARSSAGAQGPFQFMPGTAADEGLKHPWDFNESALAAGSYLAKLTKQFGGDIEKGLAAYNWGAGHLKAAIDSYGNAWKEHIPAETRKYIARALPMIQNQQSQYAQNGMRGGPSVRIDIRNNTGGSAIVSAQQVSI